MLERHQLFCIIETAILAAGEPLSVDRLLSLFEDHDRPDKALLLDILKDMQLHYAESNKGVELKEVSSGYRFQVKTELAPWIQKLWEEKPVKYSRAFLEVLSIIAYRQPVTRGEIEKIRGISVSTSIIKTLTDHEWIRIVGYKEVPGKPALYCTTKQFLDHFGLKSLAELPALKEPQALEELEKNLNNYPIGISGGFEAEESSMISLDQTENY